MKFSADVEELAAAVAYVAPVVMANNAPSPALAGILVDVGDYEAGKIASFMATDTVAFQGATVELEACESGRAVVSGRMLAEILKELPAGRLDVSQVDGFLELQMKRSRYKVPVIGEPFPAVPSARAGQVHQVPADVLKGLLAAVRHCADDRSHQAPGVLLDLREDDVAMTALTSAVLSSAVAKVGSKVEINTRAIVGIGALEAAVKNAGDTVGLCSTDGSLMVVGRNRGAWIKQFTASKATKAAVWFEGAPNGSIVVDSGELLAALRRIPLALQAGERDLPGATLSVAGDTLTLSGRNGSAVEQVDIHELAGEIDLATADVTTTLLTDVLATCGKRQVTIEFHNKRLLVRDQHENQQAAHVVMLRRGV